jgi:hypothetical protein
MLRDTALEEYLSRLHEVIHNLEDSYAELYEEEFLSNDRLNVRVRIRMGDGQLLELNEAVVIEKHEICHLGYRYHLQDRNNNLVFRYDNTPHFPDLGSFPNHKHLPNGVVDAEKPDILNVIKEASVFQNGRH